MFFHILSDLLERFQNFRTCGIDGNNFTCANKSYICGSCLILKELKELNKLVNFDYVKNPNEIYNQFLKLIESFKNCVKWLEKDLKRDLIQKLEYLKG